ncbi:hypothetical protein DH09_03675 [Bacillaceae bacterium JMAK1]|nr:hypothetical protein DH09_03675 [Bacillaceae bacterium JMAK1]
MIKPWKLSAFVVAGFVATTLSISDVSAEEDAEETEQDVEETEEESEEADEETEEENEARLFAIPDAEEDLLTLPRLIPDRFTYDSGVDIEYPEDGVRGIFSTAHSAGGQKFTELVDFVDQTDLNAMVIDVKDDDGFITFETESEDERVQENSRDVITDVEGMMDTLEESQIYPIARVVVFKDTILGKQEPELSFTEGGNVWTNPGGSAFVNPFSEEVWEYNVEVARQAAEAGFKEIQFDYVRFPEGFGSRDDALNYTEGNYADSDMDRYEKRIAAVTDFVEYAREELREYGVKVSVDIFGVAAMYDEPNIGQSFAAISENVDVISSMPYPSHWGEGSLPGIRYPDLEPYNVMDYYSQVENEVLEELDNPPVSRPWLQDFTASYLPDGQWTSYDAPEIEAQIQALYDNNIYEFLLWNAGNNYTPGVDYKLGLDIDIAGAELMEDDEEMPEEGSEEESDEESDEEDSEDE